MGKLRAIRNFSGPKGMVINGSIIEVEEPYYTDYQLARLCIVHTEPEKADFKNMKTKKK